jgi:mRNA-decapping enzyme subunit 2
MFITKTINDQECRLFLIPGVPMNTKFKPIAKFEIRDIKWFALDSLPSSKNDPHYDNSLFMVSQDFN